MEEMSITEFRTSIQEFLRSSGTLGCLKTQLRSVLTTELLKRRGNFTALKGGRHGTTSKSDPAAACPPDGMSEDGDENDDWVRRLADAIVEQHLRQTGRAFSLAIFSSEADVGLRPAGDEGLAVLLHLWTPATAVTNADAASGVEVASSTGSKKRTAASFLQTIIAAHLRHAGDERGRARGCTVGTQTDFGDSCNTEEAKSSLESRLAAVDAKHALCFARTGKSMREEVEHRMAVYREELKVQMEQSYHQRLRSFEQQQLHEARREAEEHYKVLLQHKIEEQRELERVAVQRLEAERARLAQAREDVQLQRVEVERRQRELQLLVDERDKSAALLEERLQEARQRVQKLLVQNQQLEELCATRLAETEAARSREEQRVLDIRRIRTEHMNELCLKDEEICRLRFREKSLCARLTSCRAFTEESDVPNVKQAAIQEMLLRAEREQQVLRDGLQPPSNAYSKYPLGYLEDGVTPCVAPVVGHRPAAPPRVSFPSTEPIVRGGGVHLSQKQDLALPRQEGVCGMPTTDFSGNDCNTNASFTDIPMAAVKSTAPLLNTAQSSVTQVTPALLHSSISAKDELCSAAKHMASESTDVVKNVEEKNVSEGEGRLPSGSEKGSKSSSQGRTEAGAGAPVPCSASSSRVASERSAARRPTTSSSTTRSEPSTSTSESVAAEQNMAAPSDLEKKFNETLKVLEEEQGNIRGAIENEEHTNRRAIEWSAGQQHTVLMKRQAEAAIETGGPSSSRASSVVAANLDRYVPSQQAQETNNVVFQQYSEGSDDDDILLRRGDEDSDRSF
ncbi:hypothetical protein ERJ75_001345800 [Trypanosoma vivax]|nr:hypothetical protein TRVL_02036 [Trypanosoma vivax]KAH8608311.1 hypothetical protein ERJ75_001345800 [Trypanosoma vivax]